jgi:uncharacterized membrane protein YbhN (UPF0104 family)
MGASAAEPAQRRGRKPWRLVFRGVMLLVTGVSIYLLAPSLVDLFSSWPDLKHLEPLWLLLALLFEATSYLSLWSVQRIALRTPSWFAVSTAQLTGGAAGSIIPGGAAAAGAFSYRMLVRAGVRPADVAAGLTATVVATTATVFALPVLALPAIIGGVAAPRGLLQTAYIGGGAFVLLIGAGVAAFVSDRPLAAVGRAADWCLRHVPGRRRQTGVGGRLLEQRDRIRTSFGARWPFALCGVVGKPGFDYLALVAALAAVGARPEPSLVLLAYAAGALLALIPFTPGGLGFVEAGLTGMLTLAGASAHQAVVATLAYRLIAFWLPMPVGGVAYLLFRRRYGVPTGDSVSTTSP